MRFVHRCLDSSSQRYMVLFQKDCVIESESLVGPAARLHCIFFQRPQAWRRFPRIPNPCFSPCQLLHEAPRQRGNSAKMRKKIQRGSLAGKNCAGISLDLHDLRAGFDKRPIVVRAGDPDLWIQCTEDLFGDRQPRANKCLSCEDVGPSRRARWYHGRGRRVARPEIFLERSAHQVIYIVRIPIHSAFENYESLSSCDSRSCSFRSSRRCSASVTSSSLIIFSGARFRNVSFPSCPSFEAMAFCKPSISFFSRTFSAAGFTVSE